MKPWFLCSGRGYESPHWGTLCSSGLVALSTTTEPSKLVNLSRTVFKPNGLPGVADGGLVATTCISEPGQGERSAYETLVLCSGRGYESPHWGTLCSSGLVASSTTSEPSKPSI